MLFTIGSQILNNHKRSYMRQSLTILPLTKIMIYFFKLWELLRGFKLHGAKYPHQLLVNNLSDIESSPHNLIS